MTIGAGRSVLYFAIIIFSAEATATQAYGQVREQVAKEIPRVCITIRLKALGERFHVVSVPVVKYDALSTIPPEFFRKASAPRTSVIQGNGENIPPGHHGVSYGFATCNVVLIRNRLSGRIALFHYMAGHWGESESLMKSFSPEDSDVVVFGNHSSPYLQTLPRELRARFPKVKTYAVQEKGRWEFIYRPETDQILYNNTDRGGIATVGRVFGIRTTLENTNYAADRGLSILRLQSAIDLSFNRVSEIVNFEGDRSAFRDRRSPTREECERHASLYRELAQIRRALVVHFQELAAQYPPDSHERKEALKSAELAARMIAKAKAEVKFAESRRPAPAP